MPERVYMNRIPGQRRIHIELTDTEITDILDDFVLIDGDFEATRQLHAVLATAQKEFQRTGHADAHAAEAPARQNSEPTERT